MGLADIVEQLVQPTYEIEFKLKDKVRKQHALNLITTQCHTIHIVNFIQVGRTAKKIAEEKGHMQIVELLREHSTSEEDTPISHPVEDAPGRSGDLDEDVPKSEDRPIRRGVFQRMKKWFQEDIRLVSLIIHACLL